MQRKRRKARNKYETGSRNYNRFDPMAQGMEDAANRIEEARLKTETTWLDEGKAKDRRGNQILFSKDSLLFRELTPLIQAQNRRTVTLWALDLAEEAVGQFEQRHPEESRPRRTVDAARAWAAGQIKMPAAKRAILDCHALAKELTDPADIARCHAIAQGCSVVHTTGHAMGLPIYELTAIVRERGIDACKEAVERRSQEYLEKLLYWKEHEPEYTGPWAGFLSRADKSGGSVMSGKTYEFEAVIEPVPDRHGAFVRFPYDIRKEFGRGRVKVQATFDGVPYRGSLVNMGVKNEDGSICYIIGVRKDIQKQMGKQIGDTVTVTIREDPVE